MGLVKGAIKAGIALKAFDILRREAAKPENQRKAKELFDKAAAGINNKRQRARGTNAEPGEG
ncbi:MAG: hypothetical protein ACXV2H_12810 [Actinomycetes bacterium]